MTNPVEMHLLTIECSSPEVIVQMDAMMASTAAKESLDTESWRVARQLWDVMGANWRTVVRCDALDALSRIMWQNRVRQ